MKYEFVFGVTLDGEAFEREVIVMAHSLRDAWNMSSRTIVDDWEDVTDIDGEGEDLHEGGFHVSFIRSNCPR